MDTLDKRIDRLVKFAAIFEGHADDPQAEVFMREALLVVERILHDYPQTREVLRDRLPRLYGLVGENAN